MSDKDVKSTQRRKFFRVAGLGLGAAGAAAVGLRSAGGEAQAAEKDSGSLKGKPVGYQHSDHVDRYYRLARF